MIDQAIRARIWAALGAGIFSQVISLVIQVGSLPLFLMQWDTSRYGVWLMLSAIPAYLSMADVGLVTTAGNKMTMALARKEVNEANRTFQTAQLFMICVAAAAALFSALALWASGTALSQEQKWTLWWLILAVLLALLGGVAEAVFRATHRYAHGTAWANLIRLIEWIASLVGLWLSSGMAVVALCMVLARLLGLIVLVRQCQVRAHGLAWGVSQASKPEFHGMVRPAVSFMAFPLANALTFQGATLLVGWLISPAAVTAFNAARTVSRVAVQCTAIPAHALWAEFSRLAAQDDAHALLGLYRRGWVSGLVLSAGVSVMLYFVGPSFYQWWTARQLQFDVDLMSVLLLYAAVAGMWHVPRVLLMSTNHHASLAMWQLLSSAAMLVIACAWLDQSGLIGVAWAMLLVEIVLACVCLMQVRIRFRSAHLNGVVVP